MMFDKRLLSNLIRRIPTIDGRPRKASISRPDDLPYERPEDDDPDDTSAGSRIKKAFRGACRRAGIIDFTTWHVYCNLCAAKEYYPYFTSFSGSHGGSPE